MNTQTPTAIELIRVFHSEHEAPNKWVFYAARRFASYTGSDPIEAAQAVLTHFLPSGDERADARRRANGYTVTTSIHEMRRITLRAAS